MTKKFNNECISQLRHRQPLSLEELAKDMEKVTGVTLSAKVLKEIEEGRTKPTDEQIYVIKEYAHKSGTGVKVYEENRRKSEEKTTPTEISSSPIGPGYYVGGRRFDLDGMPADD